MPSDLTDNNSRTTIRNIGIISTRIAGTDGVSLEIEKWASVLDTMRYNCFYFAGEIDRPENVSMLVNEAHFDDPEVKSINHEVFGNRSRNRKTTEKILKLSSYLKDELYNFMERFSIDLIIPENALAIPMNIPLGVAITEFIAETCIPTIAHHHDFSWERNRFLINACRDYLNMSFPPDLPSIRHAVINSLAAEQLSLRRGISNTIIPNVLDFATEPPDLNDQFCDLRSRIGLGPGDPFILQPTRVVPRKWIERSIEIVHGLDLENPVLVISHGSGDEGDEYHSRVMDYAHKMGVKIVHIDHLIGPDRSSSSRGDKIHTIADVYHCADLVTYPSGYEGFGNAFLEAIYYKKPIVVNRYSTYIRDIEPKGFDVIMMDSFISAPAIEQVREVLRDESRRHEMVEKNYRLADAYFSYSVLEEHLAHLMEAF